MSKYLCEVLVTGFQLVTPTPTSDFIKYEFPGGQISFFLQCLKVYFGLGESYMSSQISCLFNSNFVLC
jgi:hypothetical protein